MANAMYPTAKQRLLLNQWSWSGSNVFRLAAVGSGYAFSSQHDTKVQLGANILAESPALSITSSGGAAAASDLEPAFEAYDGDPIHALVVFLDSGEPSTSYLIAYLDDGMPVFGTGEDIAVRFTVPVTLDQRGRVFAL